MNDARELRLIRAIENWVRNEIAIVVNGQVIFAPLSNKFCIKNNITNARSDYEFNEYKGKGFQSPEDAARAFVDLVTQDLLVLTDRAFGTVVSRVPCEIYFQKGLLRAGWAYYARLAIVNVQDDEVITFNGGDTIECDDFTKQAEGK